MHYEYTLHQTINEIDILLLPTASGTLCIVWEQQEIQEETSFFRSEYKFY